MNALDGVEDEIVVGLSYNNETKYLVDSQTSAISPSEISSLKVIEWTKVFEYQYNVIASPMSPPSLKKQKLKNQIFMGGM